MRRIEKNMVLLLHQLIAEQTGGGVGIRDEGALESSLENAFATFDGKELYSSKEEKAAYIGYSLIANHAFVDGNKRIGMHIMLSFLELNGLPADATDEEIAEIGLAVANGKMNQKDLLNWIIDHT
jgi:death-on-curing protein